MQGIYTTGSSAGYILQGVVQEVQGIYLRECRECRVYTVGSAGYIYCRESRVYILQGVVQGMQGIYTAGRSAGYILQGVQGIYRRE